MKSLVIVFASILLILAVPFVFLAIDTGQSQSHTQTISGVTTGVGVYSTNVTLGQALYGNSIHSVTGVSSNISSDSPSAYSYNSVSKSLWVAGLDASQTRTLSVAFLITNSSLPAGMGDFIGLYRWFYIFVVTGCIVGAIYAFFTS